MIHAGTGGVGIAAITLAYWLECEVFTTCSTERKTFGPKMFCDVSDSFGEVPRVEHRPVTATGEVRNTAQQILVAHKSALVSAIGSSLVRPCPSYEIDLS